MNAPLYSLDRRCFHLKRCIGGKARTLVQLLDQLSIESTSKRLVEDKKQHVEDEKTSAFQAELRKAKFTIFTPLADYGYFGWKPDDKMSKRLSDVRMSNEILDRIDLYWKPPKLVPISELRFPQKFLSNLSSEKYSSLYPYGQYYVASLHVATCHRGVSLKEIDFVFGGSTLQMLARQDASGPYMVTRIPSAENTILVAKCGEYIQDFSNIGYQFERLVTGFAMDRPSSGVEFLEHLQTMRIDDKYNVLFCAEADAIDDNGDPVEVKASNPRYWGTKTMFQMISNGCPTLCHGVKDRGKLSRVSIRRLSSVSDDALVDTNYKRLQDNIVTGMNALKYQMVDKKAGEVYSISFDEQGALKLIPSKTSSSVLLPATNLVEELLM